jgi:hypothetical protein
MHSLGNYIILPFALLCGRRPAFLLAILMTLGAAIGAALSNSYEGHLAARIVQGLATGSTESVSSHNLFLEDPTVNFSQASPSHHKRYHLHTRAIFLLRVLLDVPECYNRSTEHC